MAEPLIPIETIRYKTYVKRALVEAMRNTFAAHADPDLRETKVSIDFPHTEQEYPAIVVRFFERNINNAGVGHREWIKGVRPNQPDAWTVFKHYLYNGDVEFAIYALSSLDRDLIADSLVQIIALGDIEGWTNTFFNRIYNQQVSADEVYDDQGNLTNQGYALYHYINLDSDNVQGFGENQVNAPWGAEDTLVYQTSYRIRAFGEFYSLPPDADYGMIERVDLFPWIEGVEEEPEGAADPAPWMSGADGFDYSDF